MVCRDMMSYSFHCIHVVNNDMQWNNYIAFIIMCGNLSQDKRHGKRLFPPEDVKASRWVTANLQ